VYVTLENVVNQKHFDFGCNFDQTPLLFTGKRERKNAILFDKRERLRMTIVQLEYLPFFQP